MSTSPLQPSSDYNSTLLAVAFQIFLHDCPANRPASLDNAKADAALVRELAMILRRGSAAAKSADTA